MTREVRDHALDRIDADVSSVREVTRACHSHRSTTAPEFTTKREPALCLLRNRYRRLEVKLSGILRTLEFTVDRRLVEHEVAALRLRDERH